MPDAVLIFTFSPVQPFIMEARRAADLFSGSRILVELAKAAATSVQDSSGVLIFPATLVADVPNKLVATVPVEHAKAIARAAQDALLKRWVEVAQSARDRLSRYYAEQDNIWEAIWGRQTNHFWEIYWTAAPMAGGPEMYADAYRLAEATLNAAKRTRVFEAAEEQGLKDSLSGRREALHTTNLDGKEYWKQISNAKGMTAAQLRPEGRERLDAIGAIKRFSHIAEERLFLSTSTVASEEFRKQAEGLLSPYRTAIEALIPREKLYRVRNDAEWPYDGDLLYLETLTAERLQDSYGIDHPNQEHLHEARRTLGEIYKKVGHPPSPYYALIVLDGDNMGKRVRECLDTANPREEHHKLSERLARFANDVKGIVEQHSASLIYNGGDDVLALAPLSQAIPFAQALSHKFKEIVGGATASAGIAIAHHLYPLDAALRAARDAERAAKEDYGRNALCIRALKRSGETLQVGTRWTDAGANDFAGLIAQVIGHFREDRLSSRFAYDAAEQAQIVTALEDRAARTAILKRLVNRHKTDKLQNPDDIVKQLGTWAAALDKIVPREVQDGRGVPQGFAELGCWLVLARFIAQGGGE